MNYLVRINVASALCVLALAMAPGLAQAYIDPGNGAYMVQALFTLVGAGLFYVRHPIQTMRSLRDRVLGRHRSETSPAAASGESLSNSTEAKD